MPDLSAAFECSSVPAGIELRIVELTGQGTGFERAWVLLSDAERASAERFRREQDREAFVRMRGALRERLEKLIGAPAREIAFFLGPQGKPEIAPPWERDGWRFNVSHSGGLGLMAFAQGCTVGVDIEQHRSGIDELELARRFFSPKENARLIALPREVQSQAFFDCWTRKEAFIKALGGGLSVPLDCFAVSLAPGEPARLLSVNFAEEKAGAWGMADLRPRAGYSAAVVWSAERAGRGASAGARD